jgi:hypothetical protein
MTLIRMVGAGQIQSWYFIQTIGRSVPKIKNIHHQ